jgi:hypothetical protein
VEDVVAWVLFLAVLVLVTAACRWGARMLAPPPRPGARDGLDAGRTAGRDASHQEQQRGG